MGIYTCIHTYIHIYIYIYIYIDRYIYRYMYVYIYVEWKHVGRCIQTPPSWGSCLKRLKNFCTSKPMFTYGHVNISHAFRLFLHDTLRQCGVEHVSARAFDSSANKIALRSTTSPMSKLCDSSEPACPLQANMLHQLLTSWHALPGQRQTIAVGLQWPSLPRTNCAWRSGRRGGRGVEECCGAAITLRGCC